MDILSVQQLLLDTPPATTSTGGSAVGSLSGQGSSSTGVQKPRPRLNVQKAIEYSTSGGGSSVGIGNNSLGE